MRPTRSGTAFIAGVLLCMAVLAICFYRWPAARISKYVRCAPAALSPSLSAVTPLLTVLLACLLSFQSVATEGEPGTLSHAMYVVDRVGNRVSPWHDVPLWPWRGRRHVVNFICEIPRG